MWVFVPSLKAWVKPALGSMVQGIGLDPNGHEEGMTVYYHVDTGAKTIQEIRDIAGGGLIASVKDLNGNIIYLVFLIRRHQKD